MRLLILIYYVCTAQLLCAQPVYSWLPSWSIQVHADAWNVDTFGNLFVNDKDKLQKIDSTGKVTFTQSSKAWGSLVQIDPKNPMKILLFSDEQQLISYVDNTLSRQQENLDLSAFDLSYVTQVTASGQADKFWVYDQDNSKIALISKNALQQQRINNISGLLGSYDVIQLIEEENLLYIIDKQQGIYQLDVYGTLLRKWEIKGIRWAQVEAKRIYYLSENTFHVIDMETEEEVSLPVPLENASHFKKSGDYIYFSNNRKIGRFSLEFAK